jgi:hypothetical protein
LGGAVGPDYGPELLAVTIRKLLISTH